MALEFNTHPNGSTDVLKDGELFGELEHTISDGWYFRSADFGDTSEAFATVDELKEFLESFETV